MGHSERLFADSGGLSEHDLAELAKDGLVKLPPSSWPAISGTVLRHGQPLKFTLDAADLACDPPSVLFEQFAIAALWAASFIGPIWHLLG